LAAGERVVAPTPLVNHENIERSFYREIGAGIERGRPADRDARPHVLGSDAHAPHG
jgi:hypothetical protein